MTCVPDHYIRVVQVCHKVSQCPFPIYQFLNTHCYTVKSDESIFRELVDSLCRDGTDAQLSKMPYNPATTSLLKAHSSTKSSSSKFYVIRKTHTFAPKQCKRQLDTKVCGSVWLTKALCSTYCIFRYCIVNC